MERERAAIRGLWRWRWLVLCAWSAGAAGALAQTAPAAPAPAAIAAPAPGTVQDSLVVTGQPIGVADAIVPSLGATVHTLGADEIAVMPQGEDAPFQQILLRSPGVVADSFGEIHVRGEHGNVQYRIDGILLPESLNGFAQELDTHFVNSVTLTDGTLPAQFGFRNSAVIDVTTKAGGALRGGQVGVYGGSHGVVQPTVQMGNQAGPLSWYASASYKQTGLGVEAPTANASPLHDQSDQGRGFVFLADQLAPAERLSLLASAAAASYQIPDTPGRQPLYTVAGAAVADSASLADSQRERNDYAVLAYQASAGDLRYQAALFSRYGRIAFNPDLAGDLAFSGVASRVDESFLSNGLQVDGSLPVDPDDTLRAGALVTREAAGSDTASAVFPASPGMPRQQLSATPSFLADRYDLRGFLAGLYLQDEWRPATGVTVNGGLRLDRAEGVLTAGQLSPRLSVVWQAGTATTLHAGYARYFTPPSLQYVPPASVALFAGTSNAPHTAADSPPRAERSDYYDAGLTQRLTRSWQMNVDGFDKLAQNLIDLGQFGNAIILAPFNYRSGRVHGAEISTTARAGGLTLYANAGYVFTQARDITSAQFEFPVAELAYISANEIRLDHEGEVSATAGAAYGWNATRAFVDVLYCSGLRRGFANLGKLPAYYPVDLGVEHTVPVSAANLVVKLRADVVNVFDQVYLLRDGTGIGIAAAQYGPRRGLYGGVAVLF